MLLFITTCVTCGALLGMVSCAVIGPILITLAMSMTLTCLWASGTLSGGELAGWISLGAIAHQFSFLMVIVGRYWAGDPLAAEDVIAAAEKPGLPPEGARSQPRTTGSAYTPTT
jgi:hypothetical protein